MCLAIPARVDELLPDDEAIVELGGVKRRVSLALVEGVAIGDYLVVHVGFAISRLDQAAAEQTLRDLETMAAYARQRS